MNNYSERRSERVPTELLVTCLRDGVEQKGTGVEINEHGLFIRTERTMQPDDELRITIQLPEGPIEAQVAARFVGRLGGKPGIGVELVAVSDLDRRRWRRNYRTRLLELNVPMHADTEMYG